MTAAVRNYVAVPFFERVPPRVMDLVITTFDNIVERAQNKREAYYFFATGVKQRQFEGPTFEEFADWHERVKNGLIERPHPSEVQPVAITRAELLTAVSNISDEAANQLRVHPLEGRTITKIVRRAERAMALNVAQLSEEEVRLEQARAIVKAAHVLNEAKLAAGYSPASITLDDTIVQQALTELLTAEADATVMDADVHMTAGNKLVDLLLGEGDADIDDKLVGCLTMDMQPELCRLLVRLDAAKSR